MPCVNWPSWKACSMRSTPARAAGLAQQALEACRRPARAAPAPARESSMPCSRSSFARAPRAASGTRPASSSSASQRRVLGCASRSRRGRRSRGRRARSNVGTSTARLTSVARSASLHARARSPRPIDVERAERVHALGERDADAVLAQQRGELDRSCVVHRRRRRVLVEDVLAGRSAGAGGARPWRAAARRSPSAPAAPCGCRPRT